MIRVLARRIIALGRNEDGAALLVTLALLMFMYVACAGVFAVGQSVKDRVYLQNVCDAAAYSAAVVQADTLSRIATLNKAMSWTYVSMTRRQMDHIVNRWLKHVVEHYRDDEDLARSWWEEGVPCHEHGGWDISMVSLNGDFPIPISAIEIANRMFTPHLGSQVDSFYAAPLAMAAQIDQDRLTIRAMNAAVTDLAARLSDREEQAAEDVLIANLSGDQLQKCRWFINREENPLARRESESDTRYSGYLRDLHANENDEDWFVAYCDDADGDVAGGARSAFDEGCGFASNNNRFFSYGNGSSDQSGTVGIQRSYRHWSKGKLYAEWSWWSTKAVCPLPFHVTGIPCVRICGHDCESDCRCQLGINTVDPLFLANMSTHAAAGCITIPHCVRVYGDIKALWDEVRYVGERVRPLVMRRSYFGPKGTITVGLARYNENPWFRVFGSRSEIAKDGPDKLKGIFAAFNPYKYIEWSWALSSAKAGYREKGGEYDGSRAYCVDWRGEYNPSNLCVSDWDAVFVPVRSARMIADDGSWESEGLNSNFLQEWIENGDWRKFNGCSPPAYNLARNSLLDLPRMHNSQGRINGLKWDRLGDLLYH